MTRLLALVLLVLPLVAMAEDVVVRSGEHSDFTRLVLEFETRPSWSLRVSEGRAILSLEAGERIFRTGDVFSRIPRSRIRAVIPRPDGLELELGCDCVVTVFEVRSAALGIDVSDGPEGQGAIRNVTSTVATGSEAAGSPTPPVVEAPAQPFPQPDKDPAGAAPLVQGGAPARAREVALPQAPEPDARPMRPGNDGAQGRVLSDLTKAIARATTQGNLRLAETPPVAEAAPSEALLADPAAANLRLRLPGEEAWLPEAPPDGTTCREAAAYDIMSWVPVDLPPAQAISALQSRLAPELDSLDEKRAVELARLYIGLGFGAEAMAVLTALAPRHPETSLLHEMAHIVDDEPVHGDVLASESDCPGRAQLWSALATGEPGRARDVVVAIGELPIALRRQLAPRIMSGLHAEGDAAAAEAVSGTIERTEGPHGAPFAIASARIEAQRAAEPDLEDVRGLAAGSAPSADEALAVLLEVARDRGEPLGPDTLARAETRADDLRGTELASRLSIGLVHAHLNAGEFSRAAARLSRVLARPDAPPEVRAALARAFFAALAAKGTDEDLLVQAAAFAGIGSEFVRQGPEGMAVASRLVDFGLPGLALRYLPEAPADPEARLLAVRARLLAADPAGALALLEGGDPRDAVRAQLRSAALRALGRAPETEETPAAPDGKPSEHVQAPGTTATAAAEGTARAFVEASQEARRRVDALLAAAPFP